jgi:SAM-dependent methyltransferase
MSHTAQQQFCKLVRQRFPNYFHKVKVVDFGSLDINGSNKLFFDDSDYVGVDIDLGKNVDAVSLCHLFQAPPNSFDVVISCEMLEHDIFWKDSIRHMYKLLRPDGLMLITCAGIGRPTHGTQEHIPEWSPLTVKAGWNHYHNMDVSDFLSAFEKSLFELFTACNIDLLTDDFRFWGIKSLTIKSLTY